MAQHLTPCIRTKKDYTIIVVLLLGKVCKRVVVEIPVTGIYSAVQLCKQRPHLVDGPFSCWLDKPSRQAIKHQYFMTFRQNSKQEPVLTSTWVAGRENNVLLHQGCLALQNFLGWFSPYYLFKTFPSKIFHLLALQWRGDLRETMKLLMLADSLLEQEDLLCR